jgi:DNA repair photolyase
MTTKRLSGTKEWAEHSVNCYLGCPHNCRYCYAREAAVRRGLVKWEDWKTPRLNAKAAERRYPKFPGRVMFPTTHDITLANLGACYAVLRSLVDAGNSVLVVTKPHWDCIEELCHRFGRRELTFRFTIGSADSSTLAYWEPGAPSFPERLACLAYAHSRGFLTGVSIEPCLNMYRIIALVDLVSPFVTDTIWVGLLNKAKARVRLETDDDRRQLDAVLDRQTKGVVASVHAALAVNPKVRWKDSVRQLLGLPAATQPE